MISFRPEIEEKQAGQRGSAVIWIFVVIALFGALSFALSQGTRTGVSTISREQARILAGEIMDYGRSVRGAVKQLEINGCTDTQISFEYDGQYVNAGAPTNKTCHVFNAAGGNLLWQKTSVQSGGTMGFTGQEAIGSVGTAAPDLLMKWEGLSAEICNALNEKAEVRGTSFTPPRSATTTCDLVTAGCKFTGPYTATYTINNAQNDFTGKLNGCYDENGTGNFIYYQVLIAR